MCVCAHEGELERGEHARGREREREREGGREGGCVQHRYTWVETMWVGADGIVSNAPANTECAGAGLLRLLQDLTTWKRHTRMMLQTDNIVPHVRKHIRAEMSTRAFCKMFELLSGYNLAPQTPAVRTVHLCEAPGAFIAATNHYLRQTFRDALTLDWTGVTLNPYYEDNDPEAMVSDDKFILQTFGHWMFGADDKGDIRSAANILALSRSGKAAHIVTADGSVDCSTDPNEQENTVAHLHYCEAVAALHTLAPGGHFVLKTFTLFEKSSTDLLYLLASTFQEVHVCKPATSTQGNAETYVIAKHFRANVSQEMSTRLLKRVDTFATADSGDIPDLFGPGAVPEEFVAHVRACADLFSQCMCDCITRNLRTENRLTYQDKQAIRQCKLDALQEFLRETGLTAIPDSAKLVACFAVDGSNLNTGSLVSQQHAFNKVRSGGTLAERQSTKGVRVANRSDNQAHQKRKSGSNTIDATPGPSTSKRRRVDTVQGHRADATATGAENAGPGPGERVARYGSFAQRMMQKMG